jgi:DENN domain-containing protein 5
MLDILDAPVPYIVGMDATYFQTVPVKDRPKDALLVDLDRDVVYMGNLEIPKVPSRDAEKLSLALEEAGGSSYLLPNSGIKGCIVAGTEASLLVPNEDRPRYAHMTTMKALEAESLVRDEVFTTTDLAYGGNGVNTVSISGFGTEHGQMTTEVDEKSDKGKSPNKVFGIKPIKKPKFMRNKKAHILSNSLASKNQGHLLDNTGPRAISVDAIRSAFLRFTVALFTEYEDFVASDNPRRFFSDKKLVAELGLESDPNPFLKTIMQTQFFQQFLEERQAYPDTPEIRFFEESIIAKINRSKKATMANGGKKRPTPFLKDETWKVTKTYTPPPPSNLGLPDNNDTYTYGTFPTLDPSRFGRIRHPTHWHQNDSTRLQFAKKNSKVSKTERDIVKLALRPILSAPGAVVAAAARSARDLDSALTALSVATGLREKKDNDYQKSAPVKRNVNTLSKADMIMINARQKVIILLECIIKMQALSRGYLARCRSDRNSIHHKEEQLWNARRLQAQREQRLREEKAIGVQSIIRMYLSKMQRLRVLEAASTIQIFLRGSVARRRWARMKSAAVTIQKNVKCRRIRIIYAELRKLVLQLQARIRGSQIRDRVRFVIREKMALYRIQIFVLWTYVHLPLAVRTKLWPDFKPRYSFLRLRLAESELFRLWTMVGYSEPLGVNNVTDKVARCSDFVGLDSAVYRRCKKCVNWINDTMPHHSRTTTITDALKGEEVERLQIYERLNSFVSDQELSTIYSLFEVPSSEKMKKVALAKKIWTNIGQADHSVSKMMLLFPELTHSLGINFHTPSAKGQRRFPHASKLPLPSLDRNLWNEISVEGNVKKHVQEVAILYMTKVQAVGKKLDQRQSSSFGGFPSSYRQAIKEVYATSTWKGARRIVIRRFLEGRYAHQTNPNVEVVLSKGPNRFLIQHPSLQQTPS